MSEELFPIQAERGAEPHPMKVPWHIAELAYSVYAAKYGQEQSLERMAERGGFAPSEMDMFLPDWRERCTPPSACVVTEGEIRKAVITSRFDRMRPGWEGTRCAGPEAATVITRTIATLLTRAGGRVVDVDALTHRVMEIVRGNYHPPKDDMTVVDYDEITTVAVRDAILAAIQGEGE